MDDALRKALRSDDWGQRAAALRRVGEGDLARREVARAARAGLEEARETLDLEFPLDSDARALLEVLAAPPDATRRAAWAAQILWGDGDPRLAEAAEAWLDLAIQQGREEGGFGHLLISSYVERLGAFLGSNGPALERTVLSPEEAQALISGLRGVPSHLQLLQLSFLCEGAGEAPAERVRELIEADPHSERVREVLVGPGRAGGSFGAAVPWRPAWVRPKLRDGLTLALSRHALRGLHLAPGEFELPDCTAVLLFGIDDLRAQNDLSGFAGGDVLLAQAVAGARRWLGDRVVRWGGNRFLVPLEGPAARGRARACLEAVAESAAQRGEGGLGSISGAIMSRSVADSGSWALKLEEGLALARERGPASLEVVET